MRALLVVLLVVLAGCGAATPTVPAPSATPKPTPTPAPTPTSTPTQSTPSPTPSRTPTCPAAPTLRGDRHHLMAFAPLDDPGDVTVEGRVADDRAWSTSKVLVVAAYLDTAVGGDPTKIDRRNRDLITAALTRSDADAITAIRDQIPGRPGPAMTTILRRIGDDTTTAPDTYQGLMRWSAREQVRFAAALGAGRVVNRRTSAFLLDQMHPIRAHAWGLGTVGATSYKGGWLRADTATRQFGLLDGYAVVIMTDAGPAVRQTDGDAAHIRELTATAETLRDRLAWERRCD